MSGRDPEALAQVVVDALAKLGAVEVTKADVVDHFGPGWQWSDGFNDWLERHDLRMENKRLVVVFCRKGST